jgi:hypothetical protein
MAKADAHQEFILVLVVEGRVYPFSAPSATFRMKSLQLVDRRVENEQLSPH